MQLNPSFATAGKAQAGFTMVEIAFVIVIFAIVTIPLFSIYEEYQTSKKRITTIENIDTASGQIRMNRATLFSYPCPSDRSLTINDANYGLEDCAAFAALAVNTCSASGGICKVAGSRDADGDGSLDHVYIGGIPFRSLETANNMNINQKMALDGWGRQLTYAVVARTTLAFPPRNARAVGNDFRYGVITALDEHGKSTAGIGMFDLDNADGDNNPSTGTDGDAQFAIISHGPSGNGAFSYSGALYAACDAAVIDGENCDADSVFVSALGDYRANTAAFYDDLAMFYKDQAGDLWGFISAPLTSQSSPHIRKLNAGRVGINTGNAPLQAELDVNGAVRAVSTLIPRVTALPGAPAGELCNQNGSACLPVDFLYDPMSSVTKNGKTWTNRCPTGQIMTGISNGQVQCAASVTLPAPPGGAGANCPAGQYIEAVLTNGCIKCTDGAIYPSAILCN